MRNGYEKLCEIVPGLEKSSRSEGEVLWETVRHLKKLIKENNEMIALLEERGGDVTGIFVSFTSRRLAL